MDYRIRWQQRRRQRQRKRLLILPAAILLGLLLYWLQHSIGRGGHVYWTFALTRPLLPHLAAGPSIVYVVSPEGHVFALRGSDGTSLTQGPFFSVPERFNAPPALVKHALYLGSDLGVLRALDARSGQQLWLHDTGAAIRMQPLANGHFIYAGNDAGWLYCFRQGGTKVWAVRLDGALAGRPVVVGEVLIAASTRGEVYGLQAETGKIIWRKSLDAPLFSGLSAAPPVVAIGSDLGACHVLRASDGAFVNRFPTQGLIRRAPAVHERLIAFGSSDGWLRAISRDGKQPLWAYRLPGPVTVGPVIAGNLLYVGSARQLVALCLPEGQLTRTWRDGPYAGDIVATTDTLYVTTSDGRVLALAVP